MKRVVVKNLSNVETHGADFATQELADSWIAEQKAKGPRCAWGRPAWTEIILDNEGVETDRIEHEDQFTIEITDVSSEYELRAAKAILKSNKEFGQNLVDEFSLENVALGINAAQSASVLSKLSGLLPALSNGYLETSIALAKAINPNDYDATFITAARLLTAVNKIEVYLGIEVSETL